MAPRGIAALARRLEAPLSTVRAKGPRGQDLQGTVEIRRDLRHLWPIRPSDALLHSKPTCPACSRRCRPCVNVWSLARVLEQYLIRVYFAADWRVVPPKKRRYISMKDGTTLSSVVESTAGTLPSVGGGKRASTTADLLRHRPRTSRTLSFPGISAQGPTGEEGELLCRTRCW